MEGTVLGWHAYGGEPAALTGAVQGFLDHYGFVGACMVFIFWMFYRQSQADQKRQEIEREIYRQDSNEKKELTRLMSVLQADMSTIKNEINGIQNSMDNILRAIDKRSEAIIGQTNVLQMLVDKIGGGQVEELPRPPRSSKTTKLYRRNPDGTVDQLTLPDNLSPKSRRKIAERRSPTDSCYFTAEELKDLFENSEE